ncbi:MAG: polysaccharide biosynthesis/export family protein [Aestuariivirga sp.]
MRLPFASLLISSLLLAGCASGWEDVSAPPGGTGITLAGQVEEGTLAAASVTRLPVRNRHGALEPYGSRGKAAAYEYAGGYRVGAGDRLAIRVAGEADLTGEYIVDGSGLISMPYVQSLAVAGLTTPKIEGLIAQKLRAGYLVDPQVSVQVAATRPFYILGEVNSAGSFSYQPGMTVQNAIAIAGGYSPRGDRGAVLLTRKLAYGTSTHQVPVTTQLYPGDIVYVRERWF